jgi:hypothetical protein
VIDPYAKVNERIRGKRRAQGRRDDEFDALIRAASHEFGAATEAALGLFVDLAERVGLRYLEEAARTGAARRFRWTPDAVRAMRFASSRLPGAGGRAVSSSSDLMIRTGLSVLQELRRRLEGTRRSAGSGDDRPRRQPRAPKSPPPPPPAPRSYGRGGRADPSPGPRDSRTSRRPPDRPEDRRR